MRPKRPGRRCSLALVLLTFSIAACTRTGPATDGRTDAPDSVLTSGSDGTPGTSDARPDPAIAKLVDSIAAPSTYLGTLPCADCPGIAYQLDLLPDDVYFLRLDYLDREAVHDEIGNWAISRDDAKLVLRADNPNPTVFQILPGNRLRLMDVEGNAIESGLNYELVRGNASPIEPRLEMDGMYLYYADAGRFAECNTGLDVFVAQEGENARLEREFGEARPPENGRIKVTVVGRLAMRPKMEGDGRERHLVVDKFVALHPRETCGPRGSVSSLEGTNWVLTRLGRDAVPMDPATREPSLVLESREHRIVGFGGCNRFFGTYTLDGARLVIGEMGATKMACSELDFESRYLDALSQTRGYRLFTHHLELQDTNGAVVARFEARELQ